MAHGLFIALAATVIWVVLQNLLMHFWPAENRLRVMLLGYVSSLPLILLGYQWLPPLTVGMHNAWRTQSVALGLFHGYFFHFLLFCLYAECFYYVERSVTLRLFVEILNHGPSGIAVEEMQRHYSVEKMIQSRLELMCNRSFLTRHGDGWCLTRKGLLIARFYVIGSWLFQFKGQHERA